MPKPLKRTVSEKRWGFVYAANLPAVHSIQLATKGATKREALDCCDSNETVISVTLTYEVPK